jgi:Tol biopolymer transport system component
VFKSRMDKIPRQCLRDGALLFIGLDAPGPWNFYLLPSRAPRNPSLLLKSSESADLWSPRVSPDGKWIAYQSDESGGSEFSLPRSLTSRKDNRFRTAAATSRYGARMARNSSRMVKVFERVGSNGGYDGAFP